MKIIHKRGFSKEEIMKYSLIIALNCFQAIKTLIQAMDKLEIKYEKEENEILSKKIIEITEKDLLIDKAKQYLTQEVASYITKSFFFLIFINKKKKFGKIMEFNKHMNFLVLLI
jgi:hypothetical protein